MRHAVVEQAQSGASPNDEIPEPGIDDLLGQLYAVSVRLSSAVQQQMPTRLDGLSRHRLATDILRLRRRRNKLFGGDLFGEPAWDIMLELYVADLSGQKLSVSGACYMSGVPLTTALRWITRLERDGWIRRIEDPFDKRRSWLVLDGETEKKIDDILSRMAVPDPH